MTLIESNLRRPIWLGGPTRVGGFLFAAQIFLVVLGMAELARAQPIHGHPEKAAYGSRAEYPWESGQVHWPPFGDHTAHTHAEIACGRDRVTTDLPVVCDVRVVLYKMAGFVGEVYAGVDHGANFPVVWDATGSEIRPPMFGEPENPDALVWTGHVSIVPPSTVLHGQWRAFLSVITMIDDGASTNINTFEPMYAEIDANAPEEYPTFSMLSAAAHANDPFGTAILGFNIVEFHGNLPLSPINQPFLIHIGAFPYGDIGTLPPGTFEQRYDMDLHHLNTGVQAASITSAEALNDLPLYLDPSGMSEGTHKVTLLRNQAIGDRFTTVLLATTFQVGPGTQPPSLCTDPTASNFGGILPCVYPPPPPPPTWVQTVGTFFRNGNALKVCLSDGKCLLLGSVQ